MSDIHGPAERELTKDERDELARLLAAKFAQVEAITFDDTERKVLIVMGNNAKWFSLGGLATLATTLRMVRNHYCASILSLLLMFDIVGAVGGVSDVVCGAGDVYLYIDDAVALRCRVSEVTTNAKSK